MGRAAPGSAQWAALALVLALASSAAAASAYDDAKKLKGRAEKLLSEALASDERGGDKSKEVVRLLESARKLLEEYAFDPGARSEQSLIEEINCLIYWTRKTSPVLDVPPRTHDRVSGEEAEKLWQEVLDFEARHPDQPVQLVARFFEAAEKLRGTDRAKEAMLRAGSYQEAAARAAARQRKELSELEKLAKKGDEFMAAGKTTEAATEYAMVLEENPSAGLARRLGSAFFKLASEHRAEYSRIYLEAHSEYAGAFLKSDRETMKTALRKVQEAKKIAAQAIGFYRNSREAYAKALSLSPKKKDIESEVYIGLTWAVEPAPESHAKAVAALERVVKGYEPFTVRDRMIYEYARNELDALKKRPPKAEPPEE